MLLSKVSSTWRALSGCKNCGRLRLQRHPARYGRTRSRNWLPGARMFGTTSASPLRHTEGTWKARAVEQQIDCELDEEEPKTLEPFKQGGKVDSLEDLFGTFNDAHEWTSTQHEQPQPDKSQYEHKAMDVTEFRKRGKEMVDYIADYYENLHGRRVLPEVQPGYMRPMLPTRAPRKGEPWEDIMRDLDRAIVPGLTLWQHPRFHAYFPLGSSFPSILADMVGNAFGVVGFSWAASPALTELETIVMDWLGKLIGLPPVFLHEHGIGGGVLQGSASDCVLVSLLAARHTAMTRLKAQHPLVEEGVLLSKLVAYRSKMAHSCVEKAGMITCVKMRELDTDENHSLRGTALQKAIDEDRKLGLIPFFCCGTVGTTSVCSFDNVDELGKVCHKEKVWLHVDAAYAGSALICPEFQYLIKGIENVKSFNLNPNKWLLVNFDCSAMWVRDRKSLTSALTVDPLYLQHHHSDKAVDFRHWGIPLSRRFRSLKLWFVLRSYGVEGLQKYIREHVRLAKKFESLVKNDPSFEILGKVTMGLVCFRLKGTNYRTQTLLRAINMSGKLHMVPALVDEKYVIRFAVCMENANDDDIIYAWRVIREMAEEVIEACDSNRESEAQVEKLASLDINGEEEEEVEVEEEEVTLVKENLVNGDREKAEFEELGDDEVFLYDDNIPSIPSIPARYVEPTKPSTYRRRNMLLRMISDPKCYNPTVLKSLAAEQKRHRSAASSRSQSRDSDGPPESGTSV